MMTSLPTPALRRKLTDAFLRTIGESGKYADGEVPGLYVHVQASQKSNKPAAKYWRMRYRLNGNENVYAKRVRTIIRAVLGFAESRGWVERNVALSNTEELKVRHVVTSNPAIERPADLGHLLLRLDELSPSSVSTAMRLLVMLPVRPGELVKMRWESQGTSLAVP